jgi:hypothetical protein
MAMKKCMMRSTAKVIVAESALPDLTLFTGNREIDAMANCKSRFFTAGC